MEEEEEVDIMEEEEDAVLREEADRATPTPPQRCTIKK